MRKRSTGLVYEASTADKVVGWLEANGGTLTTSQIIDMFIGHRPTNVNSRLEKAVANGHLVRCGELRKTYYKLP